MPYLDDRDIYDDIHNCALICKQRVFHCCNVLHRPKRSFVFSPSTSWLQLPYLCGAIQRTAWVCYVIGCIMKSHTEDFFLTHIFPTLFTTFFFLFNRHFLIQQTAWVCYVIGFIMKSHTEDVFLTHIVYHFFSSFLTHIFPTLFPTLSSL